MDISMYKARADKLSADAEKMAQEMGKIKMPEAVEPLPFLMPLILSVVLVVGALVGLTILF